MGYTHRTIFRHLIVAVVLLYFPFVLRPTPEVWHWYGVHSLYFTSLLFCAILIGYFSHAFVSRKVFALFILRKALAHDHPDLRRYATGEVTVKKIKTGYYIKQVLYLVSCSRCLAWWVGGMTGALISCIYWPMQHVIWYVAIMLVFFSMFTASVSSLVAVIFYFIKKNKKDYSD